MGRGGFALQRGVEEEGLVEEGLVERWLVLCFVLPALRIPDSHLVGIEIQKNQHRSMILQKKDILSRGT